MIQIKIWLALQYKPERIIHLIDPLIRILISFKGQRIVGIILH